MKRIVQLFMYIALFNSLILGNNGAVLTNPKISSKKVDSNKVAPMRICCILHADDATLGIIENWIQKNKYQLTKWRAYKGEPAPKTKDFDFLIIMGGPQRVIYLERYPYLYDEMAFIKQAIDQDKIVLGICLGSQLIGAALGAPASKSPEKEIGVFPITLTAAGKKDPLLAGFPDIFLTTLLHNDMSGLTSDATLLAFNKGCPRQIIRYRKKVYGIQSHLEKTEEGMRSFVKDYPEELSSKGKFIQSADQILNNDFGIINARMITILDRLVLLQQE